ncbi:hypothetical protein BLJAPNOD_00950 [Ensifer sp. M14]|nr:hypothetical protein BLJAPNOD_00950 [Ensifer sp. M14]
MINPNRLNLPLTLTLSPLAGRGDEAHLVSEARGKGAAFPFSPPAGRRWRQPDEGRMPASPVVIAGANAAPLNVSSKEARHVSHS